MGYLLRRLAATLPVMGVVAVVVFLLIHLSPGDPAALIAGDFATEEDIAQLRTALGLDQPLWQQFAGWLGRILTGDLGTSIFTQVPVTTLLGQPAIDMVFINARFSNVAINRYIFTVVDGKAYNFECIYPEEKSGRFSPACDLAVSTVRLGTADPAAVNELARSDVAHRRAYIFDDVHVAHPPAPRRSIVLTIRAVTMIQVGG